ncbi:MAG: Unknown protein [uncultured Campylobacterales bacterium]|uniref:Periplasmic protein n=1 Tax=uncultured Campylobacterales bacterium TaxID=352960 RepID=A0A6S6SHY3_9BACT|nr:MAG: Unknown protein [uncultured Campylobacterales bacterium]
MDFVFLSYKDPLFSLIVFFSLIFILSVSNYSWGIISKNKNFLLIKKFLKNKPNNINNENQKEDLLVIESYINKMEFHKAISITLNLLSKNHEQYKELLNLLSTSYIGVGLLGKARATCIEHLKIDPKNIYALEKLLYIYITQNDIKSMKDISGVLKELKLDTSHINSYINYLEICSTNDITLYSHQNEFSKKLLLQYLISNNIRDISKYNIDITKHFDLFLEKNNESYLNEHLKIKFQEYKPNFEYNLMYKCKKCNELNWIKSYICNKCYNVGSTNIIFEYRT